jgi:hypothetical protein
LLRNWQQCATSLAYAEDILGAASLEALKPTSEKLPIPSVDELRNAGKH